MDRGGGGTGDNPDGPVVVINADVAQRRHIDADRSSSRQHHLDARTGGLVLHDDDDAALRGDGSSEEFSNSDPSGYISVSKATKERG